jgi:serine/threonine protein kinase
VLGSSDIGRTGPNGDALGAIVFELLTGVLGPNPRSPDARVLCSLFLGPLCEALLRIHSRGVWHLDLKPANLMWSNGEEADAVLTIIDFGSCAIKGQQKQLGEREWELPWIAPELRDGHPPTKACDVFSVGMMAVRLLLGWTDAELKKILDGGDLLLLILRANCVREDLAMLLCSMCSDEPRDRPKLGFLSELERLGLFLRYDSSSQHGTVSAGHGTVITDVPGIKADSSAPGTVISEMVAERVPHPTSVRQISPLQRSRASPGE